MHLYPIDSVASRVAEDATAFPYCDGGWAGVIVGVDPDRANAGLITGVGAGLLAEPVTRYGPRFLSWTDGWGVAHRGRGDAQDSREASSVGHRR
jgi:hypothetical protein